MKPLYFIIIGTMLATAASAQNASRLIAETYFIADANGTLIPYDSLTYKYSVGRGGDLKSASLKYDTSVQWLFQNNAYARYQQKIDLYDNHDSAIIELNKTWNSAISQFDNSSKDSSAYLGGNLVCHETFTYTGSVWQPAYKYTYAYTGGQLTSVTIQQYNTSTQALVNQYFQTYFYDAAGNDTATYYKQWNTGTNSYDNFYKFTYTYNAARSVTSELTIKWNSTNSQYQPQSLYNSYYNASNLLTAYARYQNISNPPTAYDSSTFSQFNAAGFYQRMDYYSKNPSTSAVDHAVIDSFSYDANNNLIFVLDQGIKSGLTDRSFYFYNAKNQLTKTYNQDQNGATWKNVNGYNYYYENYTPAGVAIVPSSQDHSLMVYPNPASKTITVTYMPAGPGVQQLTIVNAAGQRMLSLAPVATGDRLTTQIDVSSLPTGSYYIIAGGKQSRGIVISR